MKKSQLRVAQPKEKKEKLTFDIETSKIVAFDFSHSITQDQWNDFVDAIKKATRPLTKLEKALK